MFLWMSCPMLKCMSNLHDCYWPSEIFISSLQIVECPILVPVSSLFASLCFCWLCPQSLGLERTWLKWSQSHPIQYLHKLSPLLSPPPLSLFTWTFFSTLKNICKHTHMHTLWLSSSHIRRLNRWGKNISYWKRRHTHAASCRAHAAEPLRFSGGHSFQSTACHRHLSCVF